MADMGNRSLIGVVALVGVLVFATMATGTPYTTTALALISPQGVFVSDSGDVLIADFEKHQVFRVDPLTGIFSTVAGTGLQGDTNPQSGPATGIALLWPSGVVQTSSGVI